MAEDSRDPDAMDVGDDAMFALPPEHDPANATDDDLRLVWAAPGTQISDTPIAAEGPGPDPTVDGEARRDGEIGGVDAPEVDASTDVASRDAAIDAAWQQEADARREAYIAELRGLSASSDGVDRDGPDDLAVEFAEFDPQAEPIPPAEPDAHAAEWDRWARRDRVEDAGRAESGWDRPGAEDGPAEDDPTQFVFEDELAPAPVEYGWDEDPAPVAFREYADVTADDDPADPTAVDLADPTADHLADDTAAGADVEPPALDGDAFDVTVMAAPIPTRGPSMLPGEVAEPEDESLERFADAVEVPAGIDHWDEPIVRDDGSTSFSARPRETTDGRRRRAPLPKPVFVAVVAAAAVVISLVIRSFLVQPYRSPTASMEPTIGVGETFVVNLLSYRLHDVHRGDVVVFDRPEGSDESASGGQLVKRVIALPGEIVEARDGVVYVDDRALDEPYLDEDTPTDGLDRQVVPPGMVFVLGDNRGDSQDSRFFGSIDEDSIAGRAALLIAIPDRITGL